MVAEKKQKPSEGGHSHSHGHGHSHSHDKIAKIVGLGTVSLGGATFTIDREGPVEAGLETEFGVENIGGSAAAPTAAWLANPDGEKLCDPVSGEGHEKHWHFKVCSLDPVKKAKFHLRVGDEEAVVDFARGAAPVNDGLLAVFKVADAPAWRSNDLSEAVLSLSFCISLGANMRISLNYY